VKAIRVHEFGAPQVMRVEETADPAPGPRQVVVAIKAAGVNPIDTYIRSGVYARKKPTLPYTPGFDGAGIVESVGPEVRSFKSGDRVYINGAVTGSYAEKALCNEENVLPLPTHLSFPQGAGVWVPYATAHHALFDVAKARPAEILMIHGASGGVGTAAVQIARALGLKVIGTAGSDRGRQLAREQGAHEVFDHHAPDLADRVMAASEGRGPDVILEMLANVNLAKDLGMIAHRGRIVVIGNRGTIEINPRDAMSKSASILGMMLLNTTAEENKRIAAGLAAGFENKTLRPVVGKEIPLGEAQRAHEAVLAPGAFGKITLIP
jgi:NADPH2:quinone reductase